MNCSNTVKYFLRVYFLYQEIQLKPCLTWCDVTSVFKNVKKIPRYFSQVFTPLSSKLIATLL